MTSVNTSIFSGVLATARVSTLLDLTGVTVILASPKKEDPVWVSTLPDSDQAMTR